MLLMLLWCLDSMCSSGKRLTLTSVAAFLTVVGYSVNDTIVIYDRIRENITANARMSLVDTINMSLNETLTRTLNTSLTTVAALIGILGVSVQANFGLLLWR